MDPTAALTNIRNRVGESRKLSPADDPIVLPATLDDLAITIDGLDHSMTTGGFPPLPWAADRTGANDGCPARTSARSGTGTPTPSNGRHARIVPAGTAPGDPMAAWLRFLLVRDSAGRGR